MNFLVDTADLHTLCVRMLGHPFDWLSSNSQEATSDDVRKIIKAIPGAYIGDDHFAHVEVNTIEELLAISRRFGEDVIIGTTKDGEWYIEIYNDYIE